MNSQELETAKRLEVAFVVLIFNDNDYGLISWKQKMHRGSATGTRIANPDFKLYAESFGIKAYQPKTVTELKDNLQRAVQSRELCVVDVTVDQSVNSKLVEKLKIYYEKRGH